MTRPVGRGKRRRLAGLLGALGVVVVLLLAFVLLAESPWEIWPVSSRRHTFRTTLSGFEEVPSILTEATGEFQATLSREGDALEFELVFSNLSSPSTVAHLHFAQTGVNGPVFAFLCGGGGKPACPGRGGTVTGTIRAADIQGIPAQGLAEGDFQGALRIIQAGAVYVNVHSTQFPAGEIRGQLGRQSRGD